MSKDIKVVNIQNDVDTGFDDTWQRLVMDPIQQRGLATPELVTVKSTFRTIISPLMDYILELEDQHPTRKVAVLLPELVVRNWWENFLHNQRIQILKLLLLLRGNDRIVVINIPWYLDLPAAEHLPSTAQPH